MALPARYALSRSYYTHTIIFMYKQRYALQKQNQITATLQTL
jgi:hypothetical protein